MKAETKGVQALAYVFVMQSANDKFYGAMWSEEVGCACLLTGEHDTAA